MSGKEKLTLPKQEQDHQPGVETKMTPPPNQSIPHIQEVENWLEKQRLLRGVTVE